MKLSDLRSQNHPATFIKNWTWATLVAITFPNNWTSHKAWHTIQETCTNSYQYIACWLFYGTTHMTWAFKLRKSEIIDIGNFILFYIIKRQKYQLSCQEYLIRKSFLCKLSVLFCVLLGLPCAYIKGKFYNVKRQKSLRYKFLRLLFILNL